MGEEGRPRDKRWERRDGLWTSDGRGGREREREGGKDMGLGKVQNNQITNTMGTLKCQIITHHKLCPKQAVVTAK